MPSKENLSAVLLSKGDLRLENRPIPKPGKNDVLIEVECVGICGSDIHLWLNGKLGDFFFVKKPTVLGHESSGTVIELGDDVRNLKIGDRVAIEPGDACGRCEFCKDGRYNLCSTPPKSDDGSLSRYYVHAAHLCHKLPDHVSFEEGAILEPLSVGVHSCRRAGVTIGSKVLICGAGPIGLVNLLTAKAMGATSICITDLVESRLEVAKQLGADHCVLVQGKSNEEIIAEIKSSLGDSPNITLECSGVEPSVTLAILATKSGGTVVIVGMGKGMMNIPITNALVREVDIRGIYRYTNCYPVALEMIANKKIDVRPLVTHRFQLKEMLKGFETAKTGADGAIKVIINCKE